MNQFENEFDQLLSQAEALLHEQKAEEALILLDQAQSIEPQHGWISLFRGVALGQLGRIEEAVMQLIIAADEHKDDVDIQVDVARQLSLLDQYQDALISAIRAIELDNADAGAHAIYAEVLEHMGRISEALPSRETAFSLDPDDPDNRYYLAFDLCDANRFDDAYNIAQPLFEQFPDDPEMLWLHGACLSYLDRHQQALCKWAELERIEGISANLLHNRASTLDALGMQEEAQATINEAIELDPENGMNYYMRAVINEHLGEYSVAMDDYLASLEYDPHHLDSAMNLVEAASSINMTRRALERVSLLLDQEPRSAALLYASARLAMDLGHFTQAQRALEDAVCCEPGLGVCWYTLSMVYGINGNPEMALHAADRAVREYPDDPGIWMNRGQALQDLQRYPEAMGCFDRATSLAPGESTAWFHLGRLLLVELNRPADARGVLMEALRLQPDHDTTLWMLALCHMRLGQLEDAAQLIQRLLSQQPTHLWGHLMRAAWHAQRGNLDDAFVDLEVAARQGYDPSQLSHEPLFSPLRSDPRFHTKWSGKNKRRL